MSPVKCEATEQRKWTKKTEQRKWTKKTFSSFLSWVGSDITSLAKADGTEDGPQGRPRPTPSQPPRVTGSAAQAGQQDDLREA
jgi:hypothetical protein